MIQVLLAAGAAILAERLSSPRANIRYRKTNSRRYVEEAEVLHLLEDLEKDLRRALAPYLHGQKYELDVLADYETFNIFAEGPPGVGPLEFQVFEWWPDKWMVSSMLHIDLGNRSDGAVPLEVLRRRGFGLRAYQILAKYAFAQEANLFLSGSAGDNSTSAQAEALWKGLVRRGAAEPYGEGYAMRAPFDIEKDP